MRIGLCGTMSVGKTTLIKELSKLPQFKDFTAVLTQVLLIPMLL